MANSIEGIVEKIRKEYKPEAEEMERTVPDCLTCDRDCDGYYDGKVSTCKDFIPKGWKSHIFFNGEWWS